MKKGFSLVTAVIFIVLIATLGALALSLSTQTTKQTRDVYLKEQADLLLQSGTEYALLALSAHNHTGGCLTTINSTYDTNGVSLFDINISLRYFGMGLHSSCTHPDDSNGTVDNITTPESNMTVMIDTYVSSKSGITSEPIRLHRRTIQKP